LKKQQSTWDTIAKLPEITRSGSFAVSSTLTDLKILMALVPRTFPEDGAFSWFMVNAIHDV
jgi:hypothetical protein